MKSVIEIFQQAIYRDLRVEVDPVPDGNFHRVDDPNGKPGNNACWYALNLNNFPFGVYGNWRTGTKYHWSSRSYIALSPEGRDQIEVSIKQARKKKEDEVRFANDLTATRVQVMWDSLPAEVLVHPYLSRKNVDAFNLREDSGTLLVPMEDIDGRLMNLQRIYMNGKKRFFPGGKIKGCFSLIGNITTGKKLYLCEGWATGATIHKETGDPVACAMNCNNLLAVGRTLQQRYPEINIIIAGDDDRQTTGNPGRTAATATALALGLDVVFPEWPADAPRSLSDFNDLYCWRVEHGKV